MMVVVLWFRREAAGGPVPRAGGTGCEWRDAPHSLSRLHHHQESPQHWISRLFSLLHHTTRGVPVSSNRPDGYWCLTHSQEVYPLIYTFPSPLLHPFLAWCMLHKINLFQTMLFLSRELKAMPNLIYLDFYGILSESALNTLQECLPHIKINKYLFSSVARPTVGIRRTSIWGLRVRDWARKLAKCGWETALPLTVWGWDLCLSKKSKQRWGITLD